MEYHDEVLVSYLFVHLRGIDALAASEPQVIRDLLDVLADLVHVALVAAGQIERLVEPHVELHLLFEQGCLLLVLLSQLVYTTWENMNFFRVISRTLEKNENDDVIYLLEIVRRSPSILCNRVSLAILSFSSEDSFERDDERASLISLTMLFLVKLQVSLSGSCGHEETASLIAFIHVCLSRGLFTCNCN